MTGTAEDGNEALHRAPEVEWVRLDGDAVLYDTRHETLHHLNRSAAAVWSACDGRATLSAIVTALSETHEGAREDVRADVRTIVTALRSAGVLVDDQATRA